MNKEHFNRYAFDCDSVEHKNIALRRAADEIERLRAREARLLDVLSSLIILEAEYTPFAGEIYWAASHETWKKARAALAEKGEK